MDWQHTKVVCTLGPATDAPGVLEGMVRAGMDVARINLSHGTHDEHRRRIHRVHALSRGLEQPLGVLADLPGPKFRVGKLQGDSRTLHEGARILLTNDAAASDPEALPIRFRGLLEALHPGERVYLADGSIALRVTALRAGSVESEVLVGGTVRSGSGINVPESSLTGLIPTEQDRAGIAFAVSEAVDWIGVSFVQSADDLVRVRAHLPPAAHALLIAKIEKRRALAALDAIIDAADGVMVARGDLGVETDLAEIPLVQKRIIAAANARARPVITATQMLESMVEHEQPTRAEVTDVANAVLDGTDAVMLSAESAVGRNPVAAVRILQRVIAATEAEYAAQEPLARLPASGSAGADQAIGFGAYQLAQRIGARAIIAAVRTVPQATALAHFRPPGADHSARGYGKHMASPHARFGCVFAACARGRRCAGTHRPGGRLALCAHVSSARRFRRCGVGFEQCPGRGRYPSSHPFAIDFARASTLEARAPCCCVRVRC